MTSREAAEKLAEACGGEPEEYMSEPEKRDIEITETRRHKSYEEIALFLAKLANKEYSDVYLPPEERGKSEKKR